MPKRRNAPEGRGEESLFRNKLQKAKKPIDNVFKNNRTSNRTGSRRVTLMQKGVSDVVSRFFFSFWLLNWKNIFPRPTWRVLSVVEGAKLCANHFIRRSKRMIGYFFSRISSVQSRRDVITYEWCHCFIVIEKYRLTCCRAPHSF